MGNSHGNESLSASAQEKAERYHLTIEEVEELISVFADHNKSGKPINLKRFKNLLKKVNEKHKNEIYFSPEAAELIFSIIDTDGGGTLDADEFIVGMRTFVSGSAEDKAKLVFRAIDKDNSGRVTKSEFKDYAGRCLEIWKKHFLSGETVEVTIALSRWFLTCHLSVFFFVSLLFIVLFFSQLSLCFRFFVFFVLFRFSFVSFHLFGSFFLSFSLLFFFSLILSFLNHAA